MVGNVAIETVEGLHGVVTVNDEGGEPMRAYASIVFTDVERHSMRYGIVVRSLHPPDSYSSGGEYKTPPVFHPSAFLTYPASL